MHRDVYLSLRRRYEPKSITLAIIAESPPISGRYFYNPEGRVSEPLFSALMRYPLMRYLGLSPTAKENGLRAFQEKGWVLIDATYEPVNQLGHADRNRVIIRDYCLLRSDLENLIPDRIAPLILVKKNVCRLLEPKLTKDGFKVLNKGRVVYFPAAGQQNNFQRQFGEVLRNGGIDTQTSEDGS
jgi:hypothetical protein